MKMELDKRIDNTRVKLMTCFNTDEAKQYLGQKGYFADEIHSYEDLDFTDFGTLDRVDNDDTPFCAGRLCYQFFLPAEFVRPAETPAEKNWRPFTLDEFLAKFPLLSPVVFRRKEIGEVRTYSFIGYIASGTIILGNDWHKLGNLFEDYELKDKDGNWTPFGVEE